MRRRGLLCLLGGAAVFAAACRLAGPWTFDVAVCSFVFGAMSAGYAGIVQASIRRQRRGNSDCQLIVTPEFVLRRDRKLPDLKLARDEIIGLEEHSNGVRLIRAPQRDRTIWVSPDIENYEALRAELISMGIPQIAARTWRNDWRFRVVSFGPFVALLAGMAMMFESADRRLVTAGAILFVAGAAFAFLWQRHECAPSPLDWWERIVMGVVFAIASVETLMVAWHFHVPFLQRWGWEIVALGIVYTSLRVMLRFRRLRRLGRTGS